MSLSSGKASGKPTTDELIGGYSCPMGEFHEGRTYQLVRHDRRIAELEVELAHAKGREKTILGQFRHAKARAEKAEAEVERLTKELDGVIEILTPSQISFLAKRRGGRESGEQSVEGVSRECPRCGWPLSLPFPPPTRKKERDDG